MTEQPVPRDDADTPPLPSTTPESGDPDQGDNQDVPAERIYPSDPTGSDPACSCFPAPCSWWPAS